MPRPEPTAAAATSSAFSEPPARDRWFGMRRAVAIGSHASVSEVADLLAEHDRLAGLLRAIEAAATSEAGQPLQRVIDIARRGQDERGRNAA